ncbi:hypothetical protein ZIOFF_069580 [Zingiber officinale]|uniref:Uncharacterized protein n=1 Tax=Zingiber officinale TaxID=94328 RepID=A0A8J5C417_ZINOF|nr:hypothetical protein ZIOFF_069580 [Zingiber officinale]
MNPFGHLGHHHHRRDEEEEEERRFPPPGYYPPAPDQPYFGGPPYPPAVQHVSHEGGHGYGPTPPIYPPPPPGSYGERSYSGDPSHHGPPPPIYPPVPAPDYPGEVGHHHHHHHGFPHFPGIQHVSHHSWEEGAAPPPSSHGQPTVRIYTKAEPNFSLSIRDGKVILARNNPADPYQASYGSDLRYSTKVKDEEGFPSFSLINKVTGEAVKHSIGATHPVRLISYNPNYLDESVLWAESKDLGDGFRCIRMVNNIRLNFDAFHGDKNHGGVKDGTIVVLWEWLKGDNQRWKIVPH